jgi:phage head maturation protease
LDHGREIHEQLLSFEEQKKRLAKLHEVYMVDLPAFDHSRLLSVRALAYFAGSQQGPAQTRVITPLASPAPNRILEN